MEKIDLIQDLQQQLKMDSYEPKSDTEKARTLNIWMHGGRFIGGYKKDEE